MSSSVLDHLSRGTFSFLLPDPAEIRRVVPQAEELLPEPQLIFLEDEAATPLVGFPILLTRQLRLLDEALAEYLNAEEESQFAYQNRDSFDSRLYSTRWERYRSMLEKITENAIRSSHGGNFPGIFWLYHSLAVGRHIQEIPKRLRRQDLTLGRDHGDEIKYKVFSKWIDRVVTLTYDTAHRLATELEDEEEALFPRLLGLMRDNVLIFSEDYVSPDLSELSSYFQGCLRIDGRDLRRRLAALENWHEKNLASDGVLRSAAVHLVGADALSEPRRLLTRSGYVSFLSSYVTYSPSQLLSTEQIQVWESLLGKIKEFELLHALRKMVVPLEEEEEADGALVSRDRSMNTTWVGGPSVLRLSAATRPMDFTAPWVVSPVVQRYGLVYDITDFSATISMLGRAEKKAIDEALRMTSSFQRKINRLASSLQLRLEKYLGDGAFYSGRNARHMLVTAVHLQRTYPQYLEKGFPFKSGLRIAMNFGEYRLLPLEGGPGEERVRYEFFGHGLVELSRLSTGKKTQEVDEFKTYLVAQGYPEATVNKFFAPMMRRNSELVSKREEARRFYAYINQNSALINEGIVATEPFISRLGLFPDMYFGREADRGYIILPVEEDAGQLLVGIRKLGIGKFKGLEPMPVYEVIDGAAWRVEDLQKIPSQQLMSALERLFASTVTARNRARKARKPQPTQQAQPTQPTG